MAAVEEYLVRRGDGLVLLFTPPFDRTPLDPGYIKGYLPGVRENGGQYTHAAVWAAMAFAELGEGAKAWELFDLINPVRHGSNPEALAAYKVEPYVVAADVYGVEPHVGRGGWTWYTGSAGWMYRLLTESLLGLRIEHGRLQLEPVLRPGWQAYSLSLRHGAASYEIVVEPGPERRLELDGAPVEDVALRDDGAVHQVRLQMPPA
jgi:cellobiose phosphorylase